MKIDDSFFGWPTDNCQWGYGDLSKIVYQRTYARSKPDGTSEQWWETVRRVVEGTYTAQHQHCVKNGLPWSASKAQRSAQRMYSYIYDFKFLPPGRGLWAMGTEYVRERGSAALNNCFSGEETIITDGGNFPLSALCGKSVNVLTQTGFKKAFVSEFGTQKTQIVRFVPWSTRSNHYVDIETTANHEWILSGGGRTTMLGVGDLVDAIPTNSTPEFDSTAFAHGLIFGDGTRHTYYPERHIIKICAGKWRKIEDLVSILETVPGWKSTTNSDGRPVVTIIRKKENWKDLPVVYTPSYLYWFLRGWIEADAWEKPTGAVCLDTIRADGVEWLFNNAASLGFIVTGHTVDNRPTNYGKRNFSLHRVTLCPWSVTFRVDSIVPGDVKPVYCATQPETASFTLASGLLTGNCAFVSTKDIDKDFAYPFCFLMDMSMLGVGVGSDCRGQSLVKIQPARWIEHIPFTIDDSREGWVNSVRYLLNAFVGKNSLPNFVYTEIRAEGEPLKGFGGVSSGARPLRECHEQLTNLLKGAEGKYITSTQIVDIFNIIGRAVVAGGIRRTAQIMLGGTYDREFLEIKDPDRYPQELLSHRWASNNSLSVYPGQVTYTDLVPQIMKNGEPGFFWLENARHYGRMKDPQNDHDLYTMGINPCGEINLESGELCNLVEVYPAHHCSSIDFLRTLKMAYLYAKTVSLIPTHNAQTNAIIGRNRRLGISVSGIVQAIQRHGTRNLFTMLDEAYEYVSRLDRQYSRWLCVPESIKLTTVKPSGTISLLAGATPGIHFPHAEHYVRNVRFDPKSPLVDQLVKAGYKAEPSVTDDNTVVIGFPIKEKNFIKSKKDVSIWEQFELAAQMQYWWADNSVSVTVTVKPEEEKDLARALSLYETRLKSVSILPQSHGYKQAPYEEITAEEYERLVRPISWLPNSAVSVHDITEAGCTTDSCSVL